MHHMRRRHLINFRRKLQVDFFLHFPRHSLVGMWCSMTTLWNLFVIKSSDGLSVSLKKTKSTCIQSSIPRNETGSRGLRKWTFFFGLCPEGLEEECRIAESIIDDGRRAKKTVFAKVWGINLNYVMKNKMCSLWPFRKKWFDFMIFLSFIGKFKITNLNWREIQKSWREIQKSKPKFEKNTMLTASDQKIVIYGPKLTFFLLHFWFL